MGIFGKSALACAALLSIAVAPAQATTIFSTFDVGNAYDCCTAWTVSGPASAVQTEVTPASGFISSGNYSLQQIDVGVSYLSGANNLVVSLWTDSSGTPGTQLGSWSVSNLPSFGSASDTVATISGISGIDLLSGVSYFLVVAPGADDTWGGWNDNSIGTLGATASSADGGATWTGSSGNTLGAFDIIGSPSGSVPEPMTLALFGAGLAGTTAARRRKK